VSNWTIGHAQFFDEFELYWLGRQYEGLPLNYMGRGTDADDVTHVTFGYGDPSYFGDAASGSWISPVEIVIQPYCGWSPKEYLSYYEEESEQIEIRNVTGYMRHYNGDWNYLTLWSGNSAISIDTTRHTDIDIEQAAQDLIPIAEDAGATLEPLPPPIETGC